MEDASLAWRLVDAFLDHPDGRTLIENLVQEAALDRVVIREFDAVVAGLSEAGRRSLGTRAREIDADLEICLRWIAHERDLPRALGLTTRQTERLQNAAALNRTCGQHQTAAEAAYERILKQFDSHSDWPRGAAALATWLAKCEDDGTLHTAQGYLRPYEVISGFIHFDGYEPTKDLLQRVAARTAEAARSDGVGR